MHPAIGKIPFDQSSSVETARQIVFARLRADPDWNHLDGTGQGFERFAEYVPAESKHHGRSRLILLAQEVFWQLVCEGVLSPGYNSLNLDLPHFHLTDHGSQILSTHDPQPHDPTGYLADFTRRTTTPDPTVMAYLSESLATFRMGNFVASTVMLGIAAERVFLMLCESLESSLTDRDLAQFSKVNLGYAMKPKLDWVHEKIQNVQKQRIAGFPDNATIMTTVIFDMLRCQRNELGHPQEVPPKVTRADAFANLQIFPRYFGLAEEVRSFLASHKV